MTMNIILKKLHLLGEEFVKSDVIKKYCEDYGLDYYNIIRYLTAKGYLLRIFKGIFYVRSFDEVKLGTTKYSYLTLVSKGMELKGVTKWYFGLYTALKLNNTTHEHFTVDYVVSDRIFRKKPINIFGYKFKFLKLKEDLFGFGINNDKYRYSDLEKTVLDLIYVWRYNGVPDKKILIDIEDYTDEISVKRIQKYSAHYPKTVAKIVEAII